MPVTARARALVLEFGHSANCYQILNPGMEHWFSAAGDAVVGYVTFAGVRVVAGTPVCSPPRLAEVRAEFEAEAAAEQLRVCYFAVEQSFASQFADSPQHCLLRLGAQPCWNPSRWGEAVAGHASMRAQLRRAQNKHVTIREVDGRAEDRAAMAVCLNYWLGTRGAPPMHFLVEPETLGLLEDRRTFVAERSGEDGEAAEMIGFLVASPIPEREGWLVEQLIRGEGAVNGTTELLVDTAMRALEAGGARYATLGLSPLSTRSTVGVVPTVWWLRLLLGWLRAHARRFYNFEGLDAFKAKLRPERWEPVYAVVDGATVSPVVLYAIMGAFTAGKPLGATLRALAWAVGHELTTLRQRFFSGRPKA